GHVVDAGRQHLPHDLLHPQTLSGGGPRCRGFVAAAPGRPAVASAIRRPAAPRRAPLPIACRRRPPGGPPQCKKHHHGMRRRATISRLSNPGGRTLLVEPSRARSLAAGLALALVVIACNMQPPQPRLSASRS